MHLQDVATTTSVENDSTHTLSHHECSSQHHYLCISPGELEAEMREAILRVKRQTSPATFHAPMDIPEQSYIPINSHLPAELPVVCVTVTVVSYFVWLWSSCTVVLCS